ncbi:MAG: class I SAM-dependent methyltransferase [Sphaerochaetaceae bacterium]|nr:class I SAM-dependent methyltransferase [Sphaerochaetaceae bacterium]
MKENKYDDAVFFQKYSHMDRSVKGLAGAGEWHELKQLLPDFAGKRVLDLGCGFGWHCRYAVDQGASTVVGMDISEKMLEIAKEKNNGPGIAYIRTSIEDIDFPQDSFDIVLSSLAFHYIVSFEDICRKVNHCLVDGGAFVFSVEHPVFTAYGTQDWYYDDGGNILHWPVDRYFSEGFRTANFLGEQVGKYHKTLTTYVDGLLTNGFRLTRLVEPQPDTTMLHTIPRMEDELRRPMMLLIAAEKK